MFLGRYFRAGIAGTVAAMALRAALGSAEAASVRDASGQDICTEDPVSVCFKASYDRNQVPGEARSLWDNLHRLREKKTIIGQGLMDFSAKEDLTYCLVESQARWVASWDTETKTVEITRGKDRSDDLNLNSQAHEIFHAVQDSWAPGQDRNQWTLADRQSAEMTDEAAARTAEILMAFELALDGDQGPLSEFSGDGTAFVIQVQYHKARDQGLSHKAALESAGHAAWEMHFLSYDWLDAYNEKILRDYIELFADGTLTGEGKTVYSLEQARKSGALSEDFNFTADLPSLPSRDDLFRYNKPMRQAYDYVESERLKKARGSEDPRYLSVLAGLEADHNPYVRVDLKAVYSDMTRPGNASKKLLDIMACYSGGRVPCPPSHPVPTPGA